MTPGQRIDRALLTLTLAPQGSAVDYSREPVSSTPSKTTPPADVDREALDLAQYADEVATTLERAADGQPLRNPSLRALKSAVRPFAGRSSGFVAFALCTTPERVEAARAAIGRDAETGLSKGRPLTSRELPA